MLPIGTRGIFLRRTQKASHRLQMFLETCPSLFMFYLCNAPNPQSALSLSLCNITYGVITGFIFLTIRLGLSIRPYTAGTFSFYRDLFFQSQCKLPEGQTNHRLHPLSYQLTSAYTFQATNLHAISIFHCQKCKRGKNKSKKLSVLMTKRFKKKKAQKQS